MATEQNILGAEVCPRDFTEAANRHFRVIYTHRGWGDKVHGGRGREPVRESRLAWKTRVKAQPSFIFIVMILSVTVSMPTATAVEPSQELKAKIALLKADDWKIRQAAVEDIAGLGGQAAGDILMAVLQDSFEEDEVREAAAAGLARMKDARAVAPLIRVLKVRRVYLVTSAAEALAKLGDDRAVAPLAAAIAFRGEHKVLEALLSFKGKAVGPLLEMLKSGSGEKRKWAMVGLGRTGSGRAVESVAAILKGPNPLLRVLAAGTLADLGDNRAVPALASALTAALGDKNERMGIACAKALAKLRGRESVAPLLAAMKDNSAELRAAAAEALGGQGDRKAVLPLAAALKDTESSVRISAAYALGVLGDKAGFDPLVSALKDPTTRVRFEAVLALGKLGDKGTADSLAQALRDSDSSIRQYTAQVLTDLEWFTNKDSDQAWHLSANGNFVAAAKLGEAATEPLLLGMKGKRARRAAEALDMIGWTPKTDADKAWHLTAFGKWDEAAKLGGAAVEPLAAAIKRVHSHEQEKIIAALGATGDAKAVDRLLILLNDRSYHRPLAARSALVALKAKAVGPLVTTMKESVFGNDRILVKTLEELHWKPTTDEEKVYHLLRQINGPRDILKIKPAPIGVLIAALRHKDPQIRTGASFVLGWLKAGSAAKALMATLDDKDEYVRNAGCFALGELVSIESKQPARIPGNTGTVVGNAPSTQPGVSGATTQVMSALKSPLPHVRAAAAGILRKARTSTVVKDLIELLDDPEPSVRWAAVSTLDWMYDKRVLPALRPLLKDPNADVRAAALHVLIRRADRPNLEMLLQATTDEDEVVRWVAVCYLARWKGKDRKATDALLGLLNDDDGRISEMAATGLGESGDKRVVEPLIAALKVEFVTAQLGIIEALGKLRDERAVPVLIEYMRLMKASYERENPAGEALVRFGPAVVKPLIAATKSPYALVRSRSAWVLGELGDRKAIEPLSDLAKDPSGKVREAAKNALAKLRTHPTTSRPASVPSTRSSLP